MGHINDIKHRLLREAVQDNAGTRPQAVSALPQRAHRAPRTWQHNALPLVVPVLLLMLSYVIALVPAERRGLVSLASLVFNIVDTGPPALATPPSGDPESPFPAPAPIDFTVFPLGIETIVVDPGHGGRDVGAITPLGMKEKDVTLDIGHRLRRLLAKQRFKVSMTREGDETVSLARRTAFANSRGADLFVSIHVNWIKTPETRGVETYYLGPTDDPHLLQLAALENRTSGYSLGDFRRLLEGVYLDVRRTESHQLARQIQRKLLKSLRKITPALQDRGVKTAPFLVLVNTKMPAILAEVSCLSNEAEAHLLSTPEYRQRIARALFKGIRAYADAFNHSAKKGS